MSAKNTRQYQEKDKEDGDLPRILLDLLGTRKQKLVARCSNTIAMQEYLGLVTILTIYRTQSMKMRKHVVFDHV